MHVSIVLLLASKLFGQTAPAASGESAPAFAWIIPTDNPDLKVIMRLDGLPDYYRFEFWNGGDAPVITKEQLLEAIALITDKTDKPQKVCILSVNGRILNYPCRVKAEATRCASPATARNSPRSAPKAGTFAATPPTRP